MNRRKHQFRIRFQGVFLGILAAAVLGGCGDRQQTRTILLPPLENQEADSEKIYISHIREYVGSCYSQDVIGLAWGEPGTDLLYLLIRDGFESESIHGSVQYQIVDTRTDTVLDSAFVDDRAMFNVSIAPGGRYVSYEVEEEGVTELVAFFMEEKCRQILHTWKDPEETYSYIWSDNGVRLFSWQNGDTGNPYAEWDVTCYSLDQTSEIQPDGTFLGQRAMYAMEGQGLSWRIVLPNADGSEVYVREQFVTFGNSKAVEEERTGANAETGETPEEDRIACNWLLRLEPCKKEALAEYSTKPVYPIKYTREGLFVQEENGGLSLIENIRWTPVKKELIPGNPELLPPVYRVCENGDHVFLMEWLDDTMYQISGVRIAEGEADGQPSALYQDHYDSLVSLAVAADQAVVFWGKELSGDEWYHYKVTSLEY